MKGGSTFGAITRCPNRIPSLTSPDGSKAVFICDWNLWVRDLATGQDRQLTTDGTKDFGYATSNAGWVTSAAPAVSWSPDGKKIATQQQDERKVGDMYLVETPVNGGVRFHDVPAGLTGHVRIAAERTDPHRVADRKPAQRSRSRDRLDLIEVYDPGRGGHRRHAPHNRDVRPRPRQRPFPASRSPE